MGVLISYGAGADGESLRQIVLNVGLDCAAEDCVPLAELEVRLPQMVAEMILVALGSQPEEGLQAVGRASRLSTAPILVLGPADDPKLVMRTLRAGAREYLDAADPRNELAAALDKLELTEDVARIRGTIICVWSPTSGSGTTTVASNLAAALGRQHPGDVAAVELSRRDGDLALFFDIEPEYTVADACQRALTLDATSLGAGLVEHETGVSILAHGEQVNLSTLSPEAVRRIAVLLRSMFRYTVIDVDSQLSDEQVEALKIADVVNVVLRADVPAVRRAQRMLDELIDRGVEADRLRLIVNRWGQSGQLPLRSITELLEMEPFQLIPDDPRRVNNAVNQGRLLTQLSKGAPITRRFSQLATQLNGHF